MSSVELLEIFLFMTKEFVMLLKMENEFNSQRLFPNMSTLQKNMFISHSLIFTKNRLYLRITMEIVHHFDTMSLHSFTLNCSQKLL